PEFIVVIMSEAPTLARASTIPGPMSRSRPAKVDGAEAAPTVVWGVGADDMVELRFPAECVIGRDGRHQVCPKHPLRGHSVSILELWPHILIEQNAPGCLRLLRSPSTPICPVVWPLRG